MQRLLILIFALVACSSPSAETMKAPAFSINDEQGQNIDFPLHHEGVDIYFFWASWCPYCKALMPHLQSILEEYGDSVRVYAFNIRDDEDPRTLLDKQGFDFMLIPEADPLMELYGVKGTPGLFLVDSNGAIQLNLYHLNKQEDKDDEDLRHSQKAARNAPWWASEIRKSIDQILAVEDKAD